MGRLDFKLPDIGEGTVEGEIVKWLVSEGDEVAEDDPVVEVMTDKATVEITSPRAGVIVDIPWDEGAVVPVGEVLVVIGDSMADAEAEPAAAGAGKASGEKAAAAGTAAGSDGAGGSSATATLDRPASGETGSSSGTKERTRKPLATPATRKLGRELGVDLYEVEGTGPHGRITKDDVRRAARADEEGVSGAPAAAEEAVEEEERVPYRGLRRKIGEQMVRSRFTAPHFTFVDEVDVTDLVRFRERAKERAEEVGVKLTYLPFIAKALVAGLKKYPSCNAELREDEGVLVRKKYYHVGIATATDRGLIVPVVKHVDRKSILEIAREIEDLAGKAREGKASPDELQGSTFTITSLGREGGLLATPIINHPETAICGVHAIQTRPTWSDGEWVPRQKMNLSFSFDHRVVDGHVGAQFARETIRYLEAPDLLLLEGI